jgi:hypothetical protein
MTTTEPIFRIAGMTAFSYVTQVQYSEIPDALFSHTLQFRKLEAAAMIGKDAIPPLGVRRTETLSEEALVIHGGSLLVAVTLAEGKL